MSQSQSTKDNNHLAVNGGEAIAKDAAKPRSLIGEEEKLRVMKLFDEAISSGQAPGYSGTPEQEYCQAFTELMGGGFADGVNSGTNAVYVALRALDLEPFGEVIYSCINDPGGVMPIALLNQVPVPADTQENSFNIGPEQVEAQINERTRAIIVAHIAGVPIDMEAIVDIAHKHGLPIVEDCSQAHGAKLNGQALGTFGDVAAFSTMFGKHHCTGGQGGVVFTRNEEIHQRALRAADRGKPFGLPKGSNNELASLNCNLSDISAAIGIEQLKKLPQLVEQRRANVKRLSEGISGVQIVSVHEEKPNTAPSYWWLPTRFDPAKCMVSKQDYCAALSAEGVPLMMSYGHLPHTQGWFVNKKVFGSSGYPWKCPEYQGNPEQEIHLPNAQQAIDNLFCIMIHDGHREEDIDLIVKAIKKVDEAYHKP